MDRHPQAFRAAIYAEYAGSKGRFWEFLEQVYKIDPEQVQKKEVMENILAGMNLDVGEAEKKLSDQSSSEFERVYRDMEMSDTLGIQITPTFFLIAKGEQPYSVTMSEITGKLDSDPKYRKLLGTGGG
jgi:predicted DsbA family dithiol-disulfide isomerase